MFKELNDDNFTLYSMNHYQNFNCVDSEEFYDDLQIFKYLKKLFYIYRNKNTLKERLILNHIIILYNVFEHKACTRMLFYKLPDYLDCLIPFLMLIGYLPDKILEDDIDTTKIILDPVIVKKLRIIIKEGNDHG